MTTRSRQRGFLLNPFRFGGGGGGGVDPDFSSVTLLLHFNNDWTDSSSIGHTLTPVGTPTNNANAKFGSGAYTSNFASYITIPAHAAFNFGTGDFTIEGWGNTPVPAGLQILYGGRDGGTDKGPLIFLTGGGLRCFTGSGGGLIGDTGGGGTVPTSTYFHWAYTRNGTDFRAFLDGVQVGSTPTSSASSDSPTQIDLFNDPTTAGREWGGSVDDIRVTKGVARYTSGFTPPTAAFPDS